LRKLEAGWENAKRNRYRQLAGGNGQPDGVASWWGILFLYSGGGGNAKGDQLWGLEKRQKVTAKTLLGKCGKDIQGATVLTFVEDFVFGGRGI